MPTTDEHDPGIVRVTLRDVNDKVDKVIEMLGGMPSKADVTELGQRVRVLELANAANPQRVPWSPWQIAALAISALALLPPLLTSLVTLVEGLTR